MEYKWFCIGAAFAISMIAISTATVSYKKVNCQIELAKAGKDSKFISEICK